MMPDTRLAVFLLWGIGTVALYSYVLWHSVLTWLYYRDRRSLREVTSTLAHFLAALGAALSVAFVLFGESGTTARAIAVAMALGAFTGAGIVLATLRERRPR